MNENPFSKQYASLLGLFILASRILIGGLFIYASVYKILEPAAFASSIRNYMILPAEWSNIVAITLPWIEIAAGIFLILGIQIRPSALITSGMLAVFLSAVIYAYSIGLNIDCGCFKAAADSSSKISILTIVRDFLLLADSFLIVLFDQGKFSISSVPVFRQRLRFLNA
jgi:putative oxidoreductase